MENKFELLKARNFSDVINDTLAFIKLHAKPMGKVIVLLVLPLLIFGTYFFSAYFNAVFSTIGQTDPSVVTGAILKSAVKILLGYIGLIAASLCMSLTIIETFLNYEKTGGGFDAPEIFSGIKRDFLRFLGFNFLLGILISVIFVLVVLVLVGVGTASVGLAVLLGFVVFFFFMYGAIGICFSPYIYLRERNGFFNAIKRSFFLIKGNWWRTFGGIMVMYFIAYFASLIFIIPFYVMFFVSFFNSLKGGALGQGFEMTAWSTVAFVFMMCGVTIFMSSIYVAIIVQYYSLVEQKEGENIMNQIDNIGTAPNTEA